ncbi:alpha/beta hydrolase [Sediminibacterium roseum]|uniref:Alpha/beta hydrolase n=1 Tax=Sediminibacterium roseum TaxID=1978412 RepID=A0ABW9ZZS0_9BACT|nr:alpha/beta hydrolase [Sediminibacterium roseum]
MRFDYHTTLTLPIGAPGLDVHLAVPADAQGIVIFSFGAGTHNMDEYQHEETQRMQRNGFGTLVFNPLTEAERSDFANRFDIQLLADRLVTVTKWMTRHKAAKGRRIGIFSAGAGTAAALVAASSFNKIAALVCRNGKLKPHESDMPRIQCPTLLIAGELDDISLEAQQWVFDRLPCPKKLHIVAGAGHHCNQPDKMDEIITEAIQWFATYLKPPGKRKQRM